MSHSQEQYKKAHDEAMRRSKRKHPEAARDEDGHCALCGYNWDEDIESVGKHLCPPGYYYESPK